MKTKSMPWWDIAISLIVIAIVLVARSPEKIPEFINMFKSPAESSPPTWKIDMSQGNLMR